MLGRLETYSQRFVLDNTFTTFVHAPDHVAAYDDRAGHLELAVDLGKLEYARQLLRDDLSIKRGEMCKILKTVTRQLNGRLAAVRGARGNVFENDGDEDRGCSVEVAQEAFVELNYI